MGMIHVLGLVAHNLLTLVANTFVLGYPFGFLGGNCLDGHAPRFPSVNPTYGYVVKLVACQT
jgi:hypothetical protein